MWTAIPQNCKLNRCWFGDLEFRWKSKTTSFKSMTAPLPDSEVGIEGVSLRETTKAEDSIHLKEEKE